MSSLSLFVQNKGYSLYKALPIEVKVILLFSSLWIIGILLGLPIALPDWNSFIFIENHYFRPLLITFLLQVFIILFPKIFKYTNRRIEPFLTIKLLYFMAFSVFLHFNFKAWMPLVNPHLFDEFYYKVDLYLWPVLQLFMSIRFFVTSLAPFNLDFLYHHLFIAMFFISFSVHALFDSPLHQRQLALGVCLILLIGGVSYWFAPAEGAFLYRAGVSEGTFLCQKNMHTWFNFVKSTWQIPPGYFAASLAAMPSLHIAHALLFTWFAGRSCRLLLFLYIPATCWLTIESVCSAWHYIIDLPAGFIICFLCIYLVTRWLPEKT